MAISRPLPMLTSRPTAASQPARAMKPAQVSATKVRSRVGCWAPSLISCRPAASWPMIVGITARADWRGP